MTTMNYEEAIHTFEPGLDGVCTGGWVNDDGNWTRCRSGQRSSILHDDPESDFRAMHDHGGGDCMCFESDEGPSYYEAMKEYVRSQNA